MKILILSAIALHLNATADAQYRKESQESQDRLVGKREWVSPPLPLANGRIVYSENVKVANLGRESLFKNALEWYNYNYKSADTRLTIEKAEEGRLSGTGLIKYNAAAAGGGEVPIIFHFDLFIRDGEYAYRFYDMYGVDGSGRFEYADMYREDRSTYIKPRWDKRYRYEMLSDMNTMIEMSIAHLMQAMSKNPSVVTN